jgi:hypothetical protein
MKAQSIADMGMKSKGNIKRGMLIAGAAGAAGWGLKAFHDKNKEPVIKSVTWNADIQNIDEDKRQVFGWATVTHVNGDEIIDKQGDYIPLEEIEKSAYSYVLNSRKGGDMHERDGDSPRHTADLIESVILTPEKSKEMGLGDSLPRYGWWLGMKVNDDEQWAMVKDGRRSGFSIHGSGRRTDRD